VEIDLVDQSQFEQLTADGRREYLEVLAAGRRRINHNELVKAHDRPGGERILIRVLPGGLFPQEETCYLGDRRLA